MNLAPNTTSKLWVTFLKRSFFQSILQMIRKGYKALYYSCPLFARKFTSNTVEETLKAALSCKGTALGYWCY